MDIQEKSELLHKRFIDGMYQSFQLRENPGYYDIVFIPMWSNGGIRFNEQKKRFDICINDDLLTGNYGNLEYTLYHESSHCLHVKYLPLFAKGPAKFRNKILGEIITSLSALIYVERNEDKETARTFFKYVNSEGQTSIALFQNINDMDGKINLLKNLLRNDMKEARPFITKVIGKNRISI